MLEANLPLWSIIGLLARQILNIILSQFSSFCNQIVLLPHMITRIFVLVMSSQLPVSPNSKSNQVMESCPDLSDRTSWRTRQILSVWEHHLNSHCQTARSWFYCRQALLWCSCWQLVSPRPSILFCPLELTAILFKVLTATLFCFTQVVSSHCTHLCVTHYCFRLLNSSISLHGRETNQTDSDSTLLESQMAQLDTNFYDNRQFTKHWKCGRQQSKKYFSSNL